MASHPKNGAIRLDDALQHEVDELSKRTGKAPLTVIGIALRLLKAEIDSKRQGAIEAESESVHEQWQKAGLIGCARGLPSDLSTNPKHMEGFGRG